MQQLRAAVEGAKQDLSVREESTISMPDFAGGSGLDVLVTSAAFEEAATSLLSRLWPPLQELGRQACVSWASMCVFPRSLSPARAQGVTCICVCGPQCIKWAAKPASRGLE